MSRAADVCAAMDRGGLWDCEGQQKDREVASWRSRSKSHSACNGDPIAEIGDDFEVGLANSEAGGCSCTTSVKPEHGSNGLLGDGDCLSTPVVVVGTVGKARRRCCKKRCGFCGCTTLATIGLLLFFLWPRCPEWEVTEISVSKSVIQGLMTAFSSDDGNSNTMYPLNATVRMKNQNFLGASAGTGTFVVTYDSFKLAEAQTLPVTIDSRSSGRVFATSQAQVPQGASAVLLRELVPNNFHIVVNVEGQIPVKKFGLSIGVNIGCAVEIDVLQLLAVPADMVGKHNCSYSYSLR